MNQNYQLASNLILTTIILCSFAIHSTQAEWSSLSTEERLTRLERVIQSQSTTIERLRNELQEMRGHLEQQVHTLESTTERPQQSNVTALPKATTNEQEIPSISESGESDVTPLVPPENKPQTDTNVIESEATESNNTQTELSAYNQAFEQLKTGQYAKAIKGFRSQLATFPNGQYAGNAQYWLGETYYVMRDFDSASQTFNQLLTQYPKSNKIAGATLKLGFIYQERGQTAQATSLLEQVISTFPDSTEAKLAQQRLKLIVR